MTEKQEGRAGIRTPDQRLRVFVSSTLVELADERAVVARAISALGLTPVLFELGARPHPPRELYRAYLSQSDILIGLYWQRYGWIGPGMDISGLEDEFRLSGSIPRLLYVKEPAPEREPRLTDMIAELQSGGVGKTRLAIAVANRLADRYPRGAVFVPLASVDEPALVLPRIAAVLGAAI